MKNKVLTVTATPLEEAGNVVGDPIGGIQEATGIKLDATLTGNTGGTLDVYIQREVVSDVWRDWVHFTQLSSGAAATRLTVDTARVAETVITAVGIGDATTATPALAAGDVACAVPSGRIRVVTVSGAGTSASAVQTIYITASFAGA